MKKHLYLILIIFFLTTAFAGLAFWQNNSNENKNEKTKIIFLDVGQGDAMMINTLGDTQILVDGGDGKDILNKLGEYLPFYDRKIELVIMTHPDKDHIGGLVEVLKYYEVEQILETGIKCEKAICEEWDKLIEEKNIPVKYAQFGQRIKVGNIEMTVLYPFENLKDKEIKNSNDASIVLRLVVNSEQGLQPESVEILLTGDAGFPVENDLIYQNINIESKILKVSHHGSKYGTSSEFLKSVKPEKAIISVGKNNYGHPATELLNRLRNMNIEIFRTDEGGDWILEY
ncbi:MAG: MBL fold metallo-hydrolase [Candidatus Pacebacteria bacterium]|nr:MBL fold metallo-hydrolase [Candidatus Paceibacterota bacterium]